MAAADQKSFLGTFSPWSTPRSSTPQPDRSLGPDVLHRSQGEDHTVTHRNRLSQRNYPSDCPPLKVRWFYAVDSPKRKPVLSDQNKPDQKPPPPPKKFIPFSLKDSQAIEAAFQRLSDVDDAQGHSPRQESAQQVPTKVPVNEDYLFDVDVEQRELGPAYWIGPVYEVRRGTWFFQDGSGLRPCEENLATQLEEGYLKLRPWRTGTSDSRSSQLSTLDEQDTQPNLQGLQDPDSPRSHAQPQSGNGSTAPPMDHQQYRLFGTYMNRIVAYQDNSTAWLTTDDFMSRVSTAVYQKLGGVPGNKVVRGLVEPSRAKESSDSKGSERKPAEKISSVTDSETSPAETKRPNEPLPVDLPASEITTELQSAERRPKSTLERQMSSLAGELQNPAELEEQARRQEEQEMEDLREVDNDDREREVDHLILVTHGIGQRLGLRLESINFIHDVNVLRKTLKGVYKASPDLQALNSAFADSNGNCRVQVLPVCWRHLLDFPYRGVRQNRKELDLTDADALEDDAYPSLADITLESVPAVRNLISDLAMDVLLYQSGYCEHISNIVKQECNRILQLYKARNPSFQGTVSLCGHSLGSAILFDILCHQPAEPDIAKGEASRRLRKAMIFRTSEISVEMLKGKTIAGYSPLRARNRNSALEVDIDPTILGSLKASKRDSRGSTRGDIGDNSAIISAPKCRDIYNIFHPSDPVSYRLEPLISPAMASLKPQPLPSVKRSLWAASGQSLSILGTRMGQSVGSLWSNFTSGVASSLLNRSLGLNAEEVPSVPERKPTDASNGHKRTQSGSLQDAPRDSEDHFPILIDPDIETLYDGFQRNRNVHRKDHARSSEAEPDMDAEDQERKMKFEDAKVRSLNSNGRVDYNIQE
ncbi:uncharacterized protein N7443_002959 [Penicillium atrosanguineum]|uniref:DDHD domain-containing protein n=1 Tax=Penicillium atrosanguineum TaxID=1132637 RepID=A0A9W9PXI5_9EURO|nr:uncharacterized protein N7443_002959 [Penicillium atrosanguineum]KAJ5310498.1 hypothetical protein N7443_002959 [Penicillium atrosanguineum]KAJ5316020.1 hypothetical protein N7476_006327 [Penicillium atrosanguineum]